MRNIVKISIPMFFCLSLAACSTVTYRSSENGANSAEKKASALNNTLGSPAFKANMSSVKTLPGIYVGATSYTQRSGEVLPPNVEVDGVTLYSQSPASLSAIANMITDATHIPVLIDDSLKTVGMGKNEGLLNNLMSLASLRDRMMVNYHGPLSKYLQSLSSFFDIAWSYRDNEIVLSKTKVQTFSILSLPSVMTATSSMNIGLSSSSGSSSGGDSGGGSGGDSGGGSGGSSGGGSGGDSGGGSGSGSGGSSAGASQSSSMSISLNFWQDFEKTIQSLVGTQGKYTISQSTSSVTVDAPPSTLMKVSRYIESLNKQLSRQVTVNVSVYSVDINKDSDWDFSLDSAFNIKNFATNIKSDFSNPLFPSISGQSGDTKLLFDALDKAGKVSVVTNAAVTTMSGQPVPLQVGNERGYISQISKSVSNGTVSTSVSTSTINSGFALTILPKILDSGRVLLQYGVNMSAMAGEKNGFDEVVVDKNTIQLPNVNQRSFIQESMINNGNTLVLAGYEYNGNNINDTGIGDPSFKALGGGQSAKKERHIIVICITPTVLDLSRSIANVN